MTIHGGDVWQVADELGIAPSELLDFSANVNPRGLPPRAIERLARDAAQAQWLQRYPDPSARALRQALSERLGVAPEAIVIGPGAAALLAPALRATGATSALVPVPAFSEYRRVCAQRDVQFVPWHLNRSADFLLTAGSFGNAIRTGRYGAIILNNPHNPSGTLLDFSQIRRILDEAEACGTAVLLDEAFIDYAPEHTLVREAAIRPGLIVVRSLTKFYGCPALRIGYAVAHPDAIAKIRASLPAWPVTQLAIDALAEALRDPSYEEDTLRENRTERERLRGALASLGLAVLPSHANYLLAELAPSMPRSSQLQMRMVLNHRILIRNCDSYEGLETGRWIRLAVRSNPENMRLMEALNEELKSL
jgi:threonine-phosphate decarboxylase